MLGAPLEYLNYEPNGPQGHASNQPQLQISLWDHVLRHRTSPNGVFGVKGFPAQFEELGRVNPKFLDQVIRFLLPGGGRARVVWLRRRDRTAHAISYARAMMTGRWRLEQEQAGQGVDAEYSKSAIEAAAAILDDQERIWTRMLDDLRIEPLILWYEDVTQAPQESIEKVASYLNVVLDSSARVDVPSIRRQAQEEAAEWRLRYDGA